MEKESHLAAIMFTDLVGYSELSQENEGLAVELLERHRKIIREILPEHGGNEIKTIGDAFLIEFSSSIRAVKCAAEIQSRFFSYNNLQNKEKQIQLRIGIHLGDIMQDGDDIIGDGVNIASRIEPKAKSGGICISGQIYDQVFNKVDFSFEELKDVNLKNIQQNIRLYHILLPWEKRVSQPTSEPKTKSSSKKSSMPVLVIGSIVCVIAVAALIFMYIKPSSNVDGNSIAVLPFENMSADKDNEYFSDGITEEILHSLAQIKELRVISRTSVFTYKERTDVGIAKIGRELDVSHVLEGSVRKAENKVRITAQLIRSKDDAHLWSQTYDRSLDDIFQVQTEISEAIAQQMKIKLVGATVTKRRGITNKPKALELYMQARYEMNKMSEKSLHMAIQLFKDAIAIDPEYALANSGIADCYIAMEEVNHFKYYKSDDIKNYSHAKSYSQKALEIEPELGEALAVVARIKHVLDKDYPEAERLFNNAIELSPDHSTSYDWYGGLLAWRLNDNLKARAMHKKALKLDPLSPSINASAGIFYLQRLKDNDSAYYYLNKAFQLEPNYVNGNHRFIFTELLENRHEWERAEKSWLKAYDLDPENYATLWGLSFHYLLRSNLEKSNIYLSKLKQMGLDWDSDYALEGWYNFYSQNIEASIPYFKKTIARSLNPKQFQYWIVWYDLLYAMGKSQKCDEIDDLNFKNIWLEFENKERDRIAEKIYFAYVEFYCNGNSNVLGEFNDDEFILKSRPNNYEYYFYTKIILLLESGETEEALNIIENCSEFANANYYTFFRHPALLPLKDNQRFQKILKKASMDQ